MQSETNTRQSRMNQNDKIITSKKWDEATQ